MALILEEGMPSIPDSPPVVNVSPDTEIPEILQPENLEPFVLPVEISVENVITELIHESPDTEQQHKENEACQYLQENQSVVQHFLERVWKANVQNFKNICSEEQIVLGDIKCFYSMEYNYLTSVQHKTDIQQMFGEKPKGQHSNVAFKLARYIRIEFLKLKVEPILIAQEQKASKSMGKRYCESDAGRGTQRYI